jgi:fimbrial chaperone protein
LISPVLIEFGPKQKVATIRVTVSDKARGPMRLQAQLLRWHQDVHGAAVTQPTDDLVIAPRIAEIKPGQQQVLRLALRGPVPAETEMAYRLVLEDIADHAPTDMGGGASINLRMAYDLPVLVAPRGPVTAQLRWKECPVAAAPHAKPLCVRIVNSGNVHVKIRSLVISGDGWQKPLNLKEPDSILAGDEREWSQAGQMPGPVRSVQVRTATGQVIEAVASSK